MGLALAGGSFPVVTEQPCRNASRRAPLRRCALRGLREARSLHVARLRRPRFAPHAPWQRLQLVSRHADWVCVRRLTPARDFATFARAVEEPSEEEEVDDSEDDSEEEVRANCTGGCRAHAPTRSLAQC